MFLSPRIHAQKVRPYDARQCRRAPPQIPLMRRPRTYTQARPPSFHGNPRRGDTCVANAISCLECNCICDVLDAVKVQTDAGWSVVNKLYLRRTARMCLFVSLFFFLTSSPPHAHMWLRLEKICDNGRLCNDDDPIPWHMQARNEWG